MQSLLLLVDLDHLCLPFHVIKLIQHFHNPLLCLLLFEQLIVFLLGVHELVLLSSSFYSHPVSRTDPEHLVQEGLFSISIDQKPH